MNAILTKMYVTLVTTFFMLGMNNSLCGQYQQVIIGAGVAPLHYSGQSDFKSNSIARDAFIQFQQGNLGLRFDYAWEGFYVKENFSVDISHIEGSLVYNLKEALKLTSFNPYVRIGVTKWKNDFTTEGYPGITDYELKIEQDKGFGISAGAGISYPVSSIALGIEAHYSKNGTSQFIAGGFEPRPFLSDQFRFLITVQYSIPIRLHSPRGFSIVCPKF